MEQFTASEVRRQASTFGSGRVNAMLNAFADMLEAREKAVPVGCLTVQRFRGSDAMVNRDFDYYGSLPDGSYSLYIQSQSAPSDAERLAEALRAIRQRVTENSSALARFIIATCDEALAAHSAQAQPPAASVTDAMVERALSAYYVRDLDSAGFAWEDAVGDPRSAEADMRAAIAAAVAAAQAQPPAAPRRTPMADTTLDQVRDEMRAWRSHTGFESGRLLGWADAIDAAIKQREQDAKDAELWRYLVRENNKGVNGAFRIIWFDDREDICTTDGVSCDGRDDEAIVHIVRDAMAKESGNG